MNDYTIRAQIRTLKGKLLSAMQCDIIGPKQCVIRADKQQTATWKVGDAVFDIEFTRKADGFRVSTRDVPVLILLDQTI